MPQPQPSRHLPLPCSGRTPAPVQKVGNQQEQRRIGDDHPHPLHQRQELLHDGLLAALAARGRLAKRKAPATAAASPAATRGARPASASANILQEVLQRAATLFGRLRWPCCGLADWRLADWWLGGWLAGVASTLFDTKRFLQKDDGATSRGKGRHEMPDRSCQDMAAQQARRQWHHEVPAFA